MFDCDTIGQVSRRLICRSPAGGIPTATGPCSSRRADASSLERLFLGREHLPADDLAVPNRVDEKDVRCELDAARLSAASLVQRDEDVVAELLRVPGLDR